MFPSEDYSLIDEPYYEQPDISEDDEATLDRLVSSDPLAKLSEQDKQFLWQRRHQLMHRPEALPKLLLSTRWNILDDAVEVKRLLHLWEPLDPYAALELLDANFADPNVRAYAVDRLACMSDAQLADVLLQLVQVLKYEPYLDSALSRFLITRALQNRHLGHQFFWFLRVIFLF